MSEASESSEARSLAGLWVHVWHPHFLVVEKPSGLLSQPGLGDSQSDSLITRLQGVRPELRLVHRLDRDTSGLLLLARDQESLKILGGLFADRKVHKLYAADVHGHPKSCSGAVRFPLARVSTNPPRYGPHRDGRSCLTLWRCAQLGDDRSRLWLAPRTGRSHQLRAHLAAIGLPVIGDPIYATPGLSASLDRLHLHALGLSFSDPFSGERIRVRSPLPWP
ncbi:pseudouridylate synthase [Synechococcus sp. WH 8020]|uniref:RluA family pseudouridine synthase n=1 Tax=unclassified Synechococcus TaxID=2626047 RepID=UPI000652654F|nr:RluA family pseudouridine synthase [Synechococcus sp. WH 8020]AKN60161.1 pseudouridylate synthase [Synechococcus sp. WH 8020]